MFINKNANGMNNICGLQITRLRKSLGLSQNQLASQLQLKGLILDKNAIQRIEAGKRFVTDIELCYFSDFFKVTFEQLLLPEED